MNADQLLKKPVAELDMSESFKQRCALMNFETLGDILFILPDELISIKGFSYSWLGELSRFLDERGLLYLLQPIPGKNYD